MASNQQQLVRVESTSSSRGAEKCSTTSVNSSSSSADPLLSLTVSALGLCAGSLAAAAVHTGGCATARLTGDIFGGLSAVVGEVAAAVIPGTAGIAARFTARSAGSVASRVVSTAVETSSSVLSLGVGLGVAVAVTGGGHATLAAINAVRSIVTSSAAQGVGFGDAREWEGSDGEPLSICASLVNLDASGYITSVTREVVLRASGEGPQPTAPSSSSPRSIDNNNNDPAAPSDADFYIITTKDTLPNTPAPYVLLFHPNNSNIPVKE